MTSATGSTVAQETRREAMSPAGHRVTLTIECGSYPGAAPVYVIARHEKKRDVRQDQRVVPVTYGVLDDRHPVSVERRRAEAKARALALFDAFAHDMTDLAVSGTTV